MRAPLSLAVFLLTSLAPMGSVAADAYDEARGRAKALEDRGDTKAALGALAAALDAYPQDYAICVELGWMALRHGYLADAERAFRLGIARSPTGLDAPAGLNAVMVEQVRSERARSAGALAPPAIGPQSVLSLTATELLFPSHPSRSSGTGIAASLDVPTGGWALGATLRYTSLSTRDASIVPRFSQEEAYARIGYGTALAGVSALGAVIRDGSGFLGTSGHAGVIGRLSPAGDVTLSVTGSFYRDASVVRIAPEWRIPLGGSFHVTPGLAVQRAGGDSYLTAQLTLSLDTAAGAFWLGGKYGEEVRPAYLATSVVYDLPEHLAWGGWLGADVRVSEVLSVRATYAIDRLTGSSGVSPVDSILHSFSLGPSFHF